MSAPWVVLGGWAFTPRILAPIFGPDATYVDVNRLMPELIEAGHLRADWADVLLQRTVALMAGGDTVRLAGWSTGAIVAAALAGRIGPQCTVLLSATPSFCARQGFPHGWAPGVLRAMRRRLRRNPAEVLTEFGALCGLADAPVCHSAEELIAGLVFLEEAWLLDLPLPSRNVYVLHGDSDRVVPCAAGDALAVRCASALQTFAGGHAFFGGTCARDVRAAIARHGGHDPRPIIDPDTR